MSVQIVCEIVVTEVGDEICVPIDEIESQFQELQVEEPIYFENNHVSVDGINRDTKLAALRIQESARAFVETTRQILSR